MIRADDAAEPAKPDEPPDAGRAGRAGERDAIRCDLCGRAMIEFHCRLICHHCGYQRDCSDP